MSSKLRRVPKGEASTPRIALCLAIVSALYLVYFVGAMIYATRKHASDQGNKGAYGAAIADREASHGPMTGQQRSQFIREAEDARADASASVLDDWLQARRARAFNRQLKGTWRTIPQGQDRTREFRAVLYKDRFLLESDHESDEMAAQLGVSGKQLWSDRVYRVRAVPSGDALEIRQHHANLTLNILPCREIVDSHDGDDCMTRVADGRLLEVAYRARELTDADAESLRLGVARALQALERGNQDRVFDP